jgi:hypothetical protein
MGRCTGRCCRPVRGNTVAGLTGLAILHGQEAAICPAGVSVRANSARRFLGSPSFRMASPRLSGIATPLYSLTTAFLAGGPLAAHHRTGVEAHKCHYIWAGADTHLIRKMMGTSTRLYHLLNRQR